MCPASTATPHGEATPVVMKFIVGELPSRFALAIDEASLLAQ
jgi:hypothetical protein